MDEGESKARAVQKKRLTFASKEFDHQLYVEVARKARLREMGLVESSFKLRPDCFPDLVSRPDELSHGFGGDAEQLTFDPDDGILFGVYSWNAEIKKGNKKALRLACKYVIIYNNLVDQPEEYARLYLEKVGKFASYPYFRSLFAIHTSAAGLALPPLPALAERMD
jgi:hypothetical protein